MLKAKAGNVVFLGLEKMNVEKLKEGLPMLVRLKELGLPDNVVVIEHDKRFTITQSSAGNPLVLVRLNDKVINSLRKEEILFNLKIFNTNYEIVLMYGDTKEIIAADIEKKYGLKMPVINPVNTQPM